jgi:hypothetical protein
MNDKTDTVELDEQDLRIIEAETKPKAKSGDFPIAK